MDARLPDLKFRWVSSAATDVLATFRRHGWTPPSEQAVYRQKWQQYQQRVDPAKEKT